MTQTRKLETIKDLSHRLQCGESTIWRWISQGNFPAPIKIGRLARWNPSEVDRFLKSKATAITRQQETPKRKPRIRRLPRTKTSAKRI
ncbi:helix-turn-helix transcriptional regulator [Celeribacter halophilus]|uniref:helix-turn-helix transcriptional regulator n=1 Tax=Celeribacter halophilus TaxID=576117 RepID=UPI0034A335DC